MINLNTNVANANKVVSTNNTNNTVANTTVKGNAQVNTGASSVVNLQTGAHSGDSVSSVKVDASNAKNMVADITAMFAKSGNAVQANLNGFDAARLLA